MAQSVAHRRRVGAANSNEVVYLLKNVNGGGKIRARHDENAVEIYRSKAHDVPYAKKLFDKALRICSGAKTTI